LLAVAVELGLTLVLAVAAVLVVIEPMFQVS
jgi:hypothetical protein